METETFKFKLRDNTYVVVDWANVYGWFSDPNSRTYLGWEIDSKKLFAYLKSYPEISDINFYYGVESTKQKSVAFKNEIETIGYSHKSKEVKWVPAVLETTAHFKVLVHRLFDVLDNIRGTNSEIAAKLYELREKVEKRLSEREPDYDSNGSVQGVYPPYAPEDEKIYNSAYDLVEELDSDLRKLNIDITELQTSLKEPVKRRKCDFDVEISRDVYNNLKNFGTLIVFSGDGDYAALVEDLISKKKKVIVVFASGHIGKEYSQLREKLIEEKLHYMLFLCSVEKLKEFIAK